MRLTRPFRKEDWDGSRKIIIYGVGRYGEIALRSLEKMGLRVDFFADRAYSGTEYLGVTVLCPEDLKEYRSAIFLIASLNYFYEMYKQLQGIGVENVYDIEELLLSDLDENVLSEYALDEKKNFQKYQDMVRLGIWQELVINHVELVVTERCTLKCKHCSSLIPHYLHPADLSWEGEEAFDYFLETVDLLLELRILGGEPFLYKNLHLILNKYVGCEKIKKIVIYTNSTVIPDEKVLQALTAPGICVHMSDYGEKSNKREELEQIFANRRISYTVHRYEKWFAMGAMEKRDYDEQKLLEMYGRCYAAKCHTFLDGKLYICPRAAHGEKLGYFCNGLEDTVDFMNDTADTEEKRKQLKYMLQEKRIFEACRYCSGCNSQSLNVKAAEQRLLS